MGEEISLLVLSMYVGVLVDSSWSGSRSGS